VIYRETKNGEIRVVPIGKSVYDLIQTLPHRSELVFCSYRGGVLGQPQLNLDFKRRALTIGIKKPVYNHIFRHSYITTMLEAGVDVSDVARIVGHKNLNSTMRYKNSLLGYYSGIAQLHPLLRANLSLAQLSSDLKVYISTRVDPKGFDVSYIENGSSFECRIAKP
jgi:site-specific recombinase XerD